MITKAWLHSIGFIIHPNVTPYSTWLYYGIGTPVETKIQFGALGDIGFIHIREGYQLNTRAEVLFYLACQESKSGQ